MFVNQSDYRLEHEWFKGALALVRDESHQRRFFTSRGCPHLRAIATRLREADTATIIVSASSVSRPRWFGDK